MLNKELKKRILILTADVSFVHWTVANAVSATSRNLGRPLAAYDIAELIWHALERGRISRSLMGAQVIARLLETLSSFGTCWESE